MAEGVRVIPGDSSIPIELSAGNIRCPAFVASKRCDYDDKGNINIAHGGKVISGASVFVFNPDPIYVDHSFEPTLLPDYKIVRSLSANATHITGKVETSNLKLNHWQGTANVFQILPSTTTPGFAANNAHYGIRLVNSTNFFEITDAAIVGQCIWRGRVNLNSSWKVPVIPGYPDRTKYLVFAQWNRADRSIDYDSDFNVTAKRHPGGKTGHAVDADCAINVVIFCNGAIPQPHSGGITIWNSQKQCTFSTLKTPFIMKQLATLPANGGNSGATSFTASVAHPMVPLCRTGGYKETTGGWVFYSYAGLSMAGNKVSQGYGKYVYQHTDEYGGVWNSNSSGPSWQCTGPILPVIDATHFFPASEIL